jgi:peptidoglycan/LPS O-acetylase OafA/YrhL
MRRDKESANLDVLRATAVMLVLVAHIGVFFGRSPIGRFDLHALGVLGVLFFFVHTSLVLMFSLERQERRYGRRNRFALFLTRRVFRIYPLCLVALGVICLFRIPSSNLGLRSLLFVAPDGLGLASNALLVQNLVDRPSVLGVMWSLPYEMQMYIFLPALFLLAAWARSLWVMLGLWGVALLAAVLQPHVHRAPDFLLYVPCFIPGIIAYYLSSRTKATVPFAVFPLFLMTLGAVYMLFWEPGTGGVVLGTTLCLALGVALPHFVEIASPTVRRVSHLIAKYSYGIYITHYFALWVAFMVLAGASPVLQVPVFLALVVAVPIALFHAVESPMIGVGNRVASRFAAAPAVPAQEPIAQEPVVDAAPAA